MENCPIKCSPATNADSRWPYHQYYFGNRDKEERRDGQGENHWSGAESLEWYTGKFLRDTMHGAGDYRWRYKDSEGKFITYEGLFYGNCMHGYGVMSYPDGKVFDADDRGNWLDADGIRPNVEHIRKSYIHLVMEIERRRNYQHRNSFIFTIARDSLIFDVNFYVSNLLSSVFLQGIFYNNMRWGPGTESYSNRRQNVGLWRGNQLIRLTWRPKSPSVSLDFNLGSPQAKTAVEAHRKLLATSVRKLGEVNSAIELLKQHGAAPMIATEKWAKLYPKNCNDLASQVCHVELFDHKYYKNKIIELCEIETMPEHIKVPQIIREVRNSRELRNSQDAGSAGNDESNFEIYYAWNNSEMMISMMKHCFKHEEQRKTSCINLTTLLSGARSQFRNASKHEFDCRNLLMSSYLGDINKVAQLINEENVHPDVADVLGNTALIYATCGNQINVIHFLIEAGADINNFNDSCCTPLSVALLRFACLSKDISPSEMVQALIPPPQPLSLPIQILPSDWFITRELPVTSDNENVSVATSKLDLQKKSTTSLGERRKTNADQITRRKTNADQIKRRKTTADQVKKKIEPLRDTSKLPEEITYEEINREYTQQVADWFAMPAKPNTPTYLYEVTDMVREVNLDLHNQEQFKDRNKIAHKNETHAAETKDVMKPSHEATGSDSVEISVTSEELTKIVMLEKHASTIAQLLLNGADPRLVRCPQSALFTAVASGSPELLRKLVQYGADINEFYPDALYYTILDLAVSGPLTKDNLDLVRAIVESGGRVDHRLKCTIGDKEIPGPTLLHAVLAKCVDDENVEEICCQMLDLLLEYGSSAEDQYQGISAIDAAMDKSFKLFDVFIKSSKLNLNFIINERNQTALVKMFCMDFFRNDPIAERLQILTNLMLYGADPLLECQDGDEIYENIFVYARSNLDEMEPQPGPFGEVKGVPEKKSISTTEKPKKTDTKTAAVKGSQKPSAADIADYKQAIALVRNCTRIQHIRWIQAKLMRELLRVVEKYEHRHWNMILPEHTHKVACGLWLTMPRCLEIWNILKSKEKKQCNDRRILRHILCMVQFYSSRSKTTLKWPLTAEEKDSIDSAAALIMRENRLAKPIADYQLLAKPFVTPELAVGDGRKFQVCFECAIPLTEDSIKCDFCKQVSFCTLHCMKINIEEQNAGIHPCNQNLLIKYFPSPVESTQSLNQSNLT